MKGNQLAKRPIHIKPAGLRSEQSGFTLIELMITIGILAILVTMAAPSFTENIRDRNITKAADTIVNAFSTARAEAVKTGSIITLVVIESNELSGFQLKVKRQDEEVVNQYIFDDNVKINYTTPIPSQVKIKSNGQLPTKYSFDICSTAESHKTGINVTISLLGVARYSQIACN